MDKKMAVNEKENEILKLLGKGKGGCSYSYFSIAESSQSGFERKHIKERQK